MASSLPFFLHHTGTTSKQSDFSGQKVWKMKLVEEYCNSTTIQPSQQGHHQWEGGYHWYHYSWSVVPFFSSDHGIGLDIIKRSPYTIVTRYSTFLEQGLKTAKRGYCRGLFLKVFSTIKVHALTWLLQLLHTKMRLPENFRFYILHFPYSPVQAPSDYHMFGSPKDPLIGWRFGNDKASKAVHFWLKAQPTFFSDAIKKFMNG